MPGELASPLEMVVRLLSASPDLRLPKFPASPMRSQSLPPVYGTSELGMLAPGNVDLRGQPSVPNPDGGMSTVFSFSVGLDGEEVLLPRVTPDGRLLSEEQAIREYRRTGRHLGKFKTPDAATAYAQKLHTDYERGEFKR